MPGMQADYLTHMLAGGPLVVVLIAAASVLFLLFVVIFFWRGIQLWAQLRKLARRLRQLEGTPMSELCDTLGVAFKGTRCAHAWSEYEETLHKQHGVEGGERRLRDVRATVPAEGFFNPEAIIDSRLGAEFFRHVPGIFTGLGIIGTFYGLIRGLMAFDPGVDAEKLKLSLGGLFAHVMDAFMFSMFAIAAAMLITLVEKCIYAACIHQLGQLANNLDSLFRSGVGEEYLSELVHASQDNATQTRQLKESLVEDLKELLVGLTERQISATREMSSEIGRHLASSLEEPLASIAETVRQASSQQTVAVGAALESLMRAFMDQMKETLGGQLQGLDEMLRASTQSLGQVEMSLRSLVADMQRAGSESTAGMQQAVHALIERLQTEQQRQAEQSAAGVDRLLDKVGSAVEQIAQSQQEMREQSQQFVRSMIERLQAEQQRQAEQSAAGVDRLLGKVESAVEQIAGSQREMREQSQADLSRFVEAMKGRVDQLADANRQTHEQAVALARTMGEVSTQAIAGLNGAAASIRDALARVQTATTRLEALTSQIASLQAAFGDSTRKLAESSVSVGGATQALATAVVSLGSAAQRLEQLGEAVQKESGARQAMLNDIRTLAKETHATGEALAAFTREVKEKLQVQLEAFGSGITNELNKNLDAYNQQLGAAVGVLETAYTELSEKLDGNA